MRFLLAAAALLLSAVAPAVAQAQTNATAPTMPTPPLALLPPCVATCLQTAIIASKCSFLDRACICADAEMRGKVSNCVQKSCTVKQGLQLANLTATTCGAEVRDRQEPLRVTAIILGTLSGVSVAVRVAARLLIVGGPLGVDDWLIMGTLLAGIPNTVIIVHGAIANGLGLDVWTLSSETITEFGRWFFIMEIVYFFLVSMTKMSLLFFYLRIFPARGIRRMIWGTVAFNAVYGLVFIFVGVFQCAPVEFFWQRWDAEHTGTCLDINAIPWANGAISIALDFWMLALPLSQLRHLKLHWKKKVGVGMMFGVGTFVTVVSILRLQSLVEFASSSNPTWDHWDITHWSAIEINVGIICACLPSLRLLLVRIFPRLGGSSDRYGSKAQDNGPSKGFSRPSTGVALVSRGGAVELESSPGKKGQKHGRQTSRSTVRELGVHSTVDRGSLDDDTATVKGGITYSRSYEVSVSYEDRDEETLVGMGSESRPGSGDKKGRQESGRREREMQPQGEREGGMPVPGERGGDSRAGGHGYHRRFHTNSSSNSSFQSPSVEKIPENVV
ncbi:hypothetical protein RB601_008473 [Gaeumannomyces tritici]